MSRLKCVICSETARLVPLSDGSNIRLCKRHERNQREWADALAKGATQAELDRVLLKDRPDLMKRLRSIHPVRYPANTTDEDT